METAELQFRILGPIEVVRTGRLIPLDGSKPRTVLAALLLAKRSLLPDTRLSEYLWAGKPPATYTAQIYTYVSRLRKKLDGHIKRKLDGYVLDVDPDCLDLTEFERLGAAGKTALRRGDFARAAETLRRALGLWSGPALSGASEYLITGAAPQLEEVRLALLEERINAELALGRHAELLPELSGLVYENPLRERFRGQLMTAYYRSDRQAEALGAYAGGRRLLAEELGVDPGPMLRSLHRAILQSDPRLLDPFPAQLLVS